VPGKRIVHQAALAGIRKLPSQRRLCISDPMRGQE
jgi:hypothetical protein